MLNVCTIAGRLVRDPELRQTQGGTPVASFTLAVDRDFKSKETGDEFPFKRAGFKNDYGQDGGIA